MAINGYKVFDTDTHVGPVMETLDRYLTHAERSKLPSWEQYKVTHSVNDDHYMNSTTYNRGLHTSSRVLGTAGGAPVKPKASSAAQKSGSAKKTPSTILLDSDPATRIRDLDTEGVDANLMLPSGWFGGFTTSDDVALEQGMYRAYHQWMNDYCSSYPGRLGAVLLMCARDIPGSLEELRRWGKSRWAWGIELYAPPGMPLDHPDIEPLFAEAQEHDLVVTLHVSTTSPPYSPGVRDVWDNRFLQRTTSHPWAGMRNMTALIGSGVMERYPRLRIATLEAGHGWLPYWLVRIDDLAGSCRAAMPELKHKPSEYALSGRYFQSIDILEGAAITNSVFDHLGDGVLMYASDYPHNESFFPESVNKVLAWDMSEERKRKLFWENPVKFYARSGLK